MKKLITILIAATMFVSCTKQVVHNKQTPIEEFATAKKANKGKGGQQAEAPLAPFVISSSGNNHVEWTSPDLQPGNKYTWVEVDFYDSVKVLGGVMSYVSSTTPVNSYDKPDARYGAYQIPAGTWNIKVYVWEATPNPLAGQWNILGYYEPDYITSSWIQHESVPISNVTFN